MPSFRPELGTHRYSQPFATHHDYLVNRKCAGTIEIICTQSCNSVLSAIVNLLNLHKLI